LPGFVALWEGRRAGLVTYRISGAECEIVTLDSLESGLGIGTALLKAALAAARQAGCRRAWLITTNDNLDALGFYQKRGFVLTALYPGALVQSRLLKPQIPLVGQHGIPLRDELELEVRLGPERA
jgi:GNAT superfamily N-acetyltransferase